MGPRLEWLEPRIVFGALPTDPDNPPPTVPCTTCPCPPPPPTRGPSGPNGPNGGPSGPGPNGGASGGPGPGPDFGSGLKYTDMPLVGPSTTSNPVRSFDGLPVVSATDLQSNAFGFSWGITRSWTGTDVADPVGNGWSVTGLPQLIVSGGLNVAYPPGGGSLWTPSDAPAGSYPDDRLEVVDGGLSTFTFSIANGGPTRPTRRGAARPSASRSRGTRPTAWST